MKKLICAALTAALTLSLAACGSTPAPSVPAAPSASAAGSTAASIPGGATISLRVGASPAPHAEILEQAIPLLAKEGIVLEVIEFDDYVLPNLALDEGTLDANYFQHKPYLDTFNEANGTNLVSAAAIHYEPLGIYPGKGTDLAAVADGASIGIPNDGSNEARALYLLEAQGLIKVDHAAAYAATPLDITENTKNIKFVELDADKLPGALPDMDFGVINGNYAIAAGINESVLLTEDAAGDSAKTYGNVIAVRPGDESRAEIQSLVKVLQGPEIKAFIEEKYKGSVVVLG